MFGEGINELICRSLALLWGTVDEFAEVNEGKFKVGKDAHGCGVLINLRRRRHGYFRPVMTIWRYEKTDQQSAQLFDEFTVAMAKM